MNRMLLWVMVILLLAGCGGSDAPLMQATQTEPFPLTGRWGGYFPGSSRENPEAGLEIDFGHLSHNAFLHRTKPYHATRSTAVVKREGSEVVLEFPTKHGDNSVFSGTFVNQHTLRGRFTNPQRGEDFSMDLVSAVSASPKTDLQPANRLKSTPILATQSQNVLLLIDGYDDRGTGYEFAFGLGYYYKPGFGRVFGDNLPPGADEALIKTNVVVSTAVIQMAFFPQWISFDVYEDYDQLTYLATFEVLMSDFARINPNDPNAATPIEVYKSSQIGVFPEDVSVARCTMRYIPFPDDYNNPAIGNFPTGIQGQVRIDNQTYKVPRSVAVLLEGFRGVEKLPDPPPVVSPVAKISYLNGNPPNRITFDSSGSSDPSGSPLTYSWSFGDGTSSTEPNPTHVFGPGLHNVQLTVTNQQGGTGHDTVTLGF